MTTFELLETLEELDRAFANQPQFFAFLKYLAVDWHNIRTISDRLPYTDRPSAGTLVDQVNSRITNIITLLKAGRPSRIFPAVVPIKNDMQRILASLGANLTEPISRLPVLIEQFEASYENAIRDYQPSQILALLGKSAELQDLLDSVRQTAQFLKSRLSFETPGDGLEYLIFGLDSSANSDDVVAKLAALNRLYALLCQLLDVSSASFPLKIVRLETGSFWAVLLGSGTVLALLKDLIKSGFGYLHRNYTVEGRLTEIPRKVEVVRSFFNLGKEQGFDAERINKIANESLILIGDDMNGLLSRASRVTLNKEVLEAPTHIQERLAASGEPRLINGPSSQVDVPTSDEDADK
ncbi:MAG TPA: hypothetical protein VNF45_07755 [Candidatus Binataceae bacterium]|nr:hypothetical protein [Candidatus Binataceae bacterium]